MESRKVRDVAMVLVLLAVSVMVAVAEAKREEKKMVVYMHDILEGKRVTGVTVAGLNGTKSGPLSFGTVIVIDDKVTEGPDMHSKEIGRAQGIYANADLGATDFHLMLSFIFKHKGNSTLEIQGADRYLMPKREVSVVGGTGHYRYARGYAVVETVTFVNTNATLKFTLHFRLD